MSEFAKNVLGFRKVHLSSTEAIAFPTQLDSKVSPRPVPLPTQFSFNMPSINTPPQTSCLGAIAVFTGGSINCSTGLDVVGGNVIVGAGEYMRVSPVVNIEVAGWSNQNYYRPTKAGNTGMTATFDAETSLIDAVNVDTISKNAANITTQESEGLNPVPLGLTNTDIPLISDPLLSATTEQGELYDGAGGVMKPMEDTTLGTLYQHATNITEYPSATIKQNYADVSSNSLVFGIDLKANPQSIKLKPLTNTQSWRTGICVGNPFSKQITCSVFLQQGYNTDLVIDTTKNSTLYQQRDLVGLSQTFSDGAGGTIETNPVDSIASVDLYFDFLLYDMDRISGDKLQALLSI